MESFLINILASVVGGLILIITAGILSRQARWILTGLLARLLNVDIDYVFKNKADVLHDLKAEIRKTPAVDVFVSRGSELQRETYAPLFLDKPESKRVNTRILLPATKLDRTI